MMQKASCCACSSEEDELRKGWWEALLRMGPGPGLRWDGMCKGFMKAWAGCETVYSHTDLQGCWWKTKNRVCQFSLRICHFLIVALTLSCGQGRGSFPRTATCTSLPGSAPNNTDAFHLRSFFLQTHWHLLFAFMTETCPFYEKGFFVVEASGQKWEIWYV